MSALLLVPPTGVSNEVESWFLIETFLTLAVIFVSNVCYLTQKGVRHFDCNTTPLTQSRSKANPSKLFNY